MPCMIRESQRCLTVCGHCCLAQAILCTKTVVLFTFGSLSMLIQRLFQANWNMHCVSSTKNRASKKVMFHKETFSLGTGHDQILWELECRHRQFNNLSILRCNKEKVSMNSAKRCQKLLKHC